MTSFALVASGHDKQFAEAIRDGLSGARGNGSAAILSLRKASSAPHNPTVVLIWSSAFELDANAAGSAVDVQGLIQLWSDGRLVIVRRDDTPLPLGMRDLASLAPGRTAEEVCAAITRERGSYSLVERESAVLFSRLSAAHRDDAHPAKEIRKKKGSPLVPVAIGLLVAAIGGGSLYYFTRLPDTQALMAALEVANKSNEQLIQARQGGQLAMKQLEEAKKREAEAKASGDVAKQQQLAEETRQREAEVLRQGELVKQREAEAKAAVGKAEEAAKKAKDGDAQMAQEKGVQDKAAAEKAAADKVAPAKVAPTAPAAPKPVPEAPKTKITASTGAAERLLIREEEAAAKKAAEARAASGAGTEAKSGPGEQVASVAPSLTDPAAPKVSLFQQGKAAESSGNIKGAVRLYVRAVRAGEFEAAKALGDIFADGKGDVTKDYAESLKYYAIAEKNGVKLERTTGRGRATEVSGGEKESASAVQPKPAATAAGDAGSKQQADPTRQIETEPQVLSPVALGMLIVIVLVAACFVALRRAPIAIWIRARIAPGSATPPRAAPPAAPISADGGTLFVSYSHKDRQRIEPIVSQIEEMGRRVWMDRTDITGQAGWAGQIVRAIRECRAVVLMASPNSYGSDQVVRELYLAMNHKKPIVPIEIEPADLPDELQYILAPFQHHRLSGGESRVVIGRALAAV